MELFQAVDESSTDPVDNVTGKKLVERIELFKYADTKADLHQLFQDKGLVQKPVEERESIMQKRKEARDEEERLRQERRDRIAQDRLQRTMERQLKGDGMPAEERRDKIKQRWRESSQRKLKLAEKLSKKAETGEPEDAINDEL